MSIHATSHYFSINVNNKKTAKIINGDIILPALCQCQRASKVISPFIIFAVFDVSFRRYKLLINYSFFYIFIFCFITAVCVHTIDCRYARRGSSPKILGCWPLGLFMSPTHKNSCHYGLH